MTRALYFDCFSGCSGDMILGALLDSGFPLDKLSKGLGGLNLTGYQITAEKVLRSSISATKFDVVLDKSLPQPPR
jgi:pyridinium-3,5-bisthiocarboxylic acid mononucleotide nickel chelatase